MRNDISLRLITAADTKQILEIYTPSVLGSAISFEDVVPTEAEMKTRIEKISSRYPWLVATDENSRVVGYAYATQHRERAAYRWSVDVAVYVHADAHGKRIGSQLYTRLFEILKELNYYRAFAGITLPNEASVKIHEKMGFKHLGTYKNVGFKNGQWRDVGWWELTLQLPAVNPTTPRSISEMG